MTTKLSGLNKKTTKCLKIDGEQLRKLVEWTHLKSLIFCHAHMQIEEFQQLDKLEIASQIKDSFLEPLQCFQILNSSNYVNASDDWNITDSNLLSLQMLKIT